MNSSACFTLAEVARFRQARRRGISLFVALMLSLAPLSVSVAGDSARDTGMTTRLESSNYLKGVEAYRAGEYRRAFDAWSLGAYEEDAESQYNLGVLYLEGRGVARNPVQGRSWFLRAAEKNHAEAQYNLGHMSLSGMAVEKDIAAALEWWRRSAEAGYAQAQFNYGRALYLGVNNEADPAAGLVFIRQAAANGDARAQEFLDENEIEVAGIASASPDASLMLSSAQTSEPDDKGAVERVDDRVESMVESAVVEDLAVPMVQPDRVQGSEASAGPTVVIRQADERARLDVVIPTPAVERRAIFNPPALNIVRDEAPILHDYFLRTVDQEVPLYAGIDSIVPIATLAGKTLLRVRTAEADKLQVDAITRSEVWVLALGVEETTDGLAVSNGSLVPMFDKPGGRQTGVLPQYQAMLVLEQRKGWRKLSFARPLSGWIDARSLAYSGETASQLKARWEASLKGLALSRQGVN